MINLLPDDMKKELRAARANVILIRYTALIIAAFGFLVLVLFGSYVLLAQTKASADSLVEANNTNAAEYAETQQQITALSSNLSGASALLDAQVSYAETLRSIGRQMPEGTVIASIELTPATFAGTPVTLQVFATSAEATVSLRERLQSSANFSSINLASVEETGGIDGYPVSASLTMTIGRVGL